MNILVDTNNRFTTFPIIHSDIRELFLKQKAALWYVHEVDLTSDKYDWVKLSANEQDFIKKILAFFAASDGIVNENLAIRFFDDVKVSESRDFYALQIAIEREHGEMYSLLIDEYITDENEKNELFNAIVTVPSIQKKAEWTLKWIRSDRSFPTRLIAFAIVEGIFFSGAFCAIYWIAQKKILPGLCKSNSYIARDEGLHCEHAVLLYTKKIPKKDRLSQEEITEIFNEAVELEKEFIVSILPWSLVGMNATLMSQYIEFVADRLLLQLGYSELYKKDNPFKFMNEINLSTQNNNFDVRSTDYVKNINTSNETKLSLSVDF